MSVLRTNPTGKKYKVAVGMSGGVDSSVAAHLLVEQGFDVTGVFIRCWEAKADGCRADEDRADAVAVATKLGIPFVTLDFISDYKNKVIENFYQEYSKGRTPNPDVMCNKEIKFGMFLDWALAEGFDFIATGHYAGVSSVPEVAKATSTTSTGSAELYLLQGSDASKDQSYFLYTLKQEHLKKVMFPLENLKKEQVRSIAKKLNLQTYDKPDSMGICFIGEVDIKEFLHKRISFHKGLVVDEQGEIIGEHDGIEFYTVGQRHGFRINRYVGLPLYVVGKNVEKNELIVGYAAQANVSIFSVEDLSWVGSVPAFPLKCDVRVRHLGEMHDCRVISSSSKSGASGTTTEHKMENSLLVTLEDPIFGVAPGQSAVFYSGNKVLGGGIIGFTQR
ncbi:tRNA 2-thiouridine(34) synthase MnmA [Candidatus Nomurabacteria bacterium]|uniref:tRNA-specific 2-thiouridylase MnmA n=1 Tax=candidate division WWE3 bacterium TaxID=2053526 RepID=A0A955E065_UNCKA|nr:tRNA 2-thiouridine(34) synthase MnmA [candidate division WWE3 bacterium]MCB9823581.1 tRNA 2-thiouridine(34) synthase MnmA [Candidatus Nomurabacteria bacterium]MCB9827376.1 tRNA 2-thiouridine(34) synthase MnmA [Candidatus Nomurabacteria bacterium]HXK52633.1 tRNA 2-thiouridine(34) synthase MnmA [bacterium]